MIEPKGYFLNFLKTQMDGLTGHIEAVGFPYDSIVWGGDECFNETRNPTWWFYEQTGYWLDGYTRCAILLQDEKAIFRASEIIYSVLKNPDADGYLGPKQLKEPGEFNRWSHVVFFRACMALYEYNKDENIISRLANHYLNSPCSYDKARNVLNIEIILWLYGKTGNQALLSLGLQAYNDYNKLCKDDLCDRVALSSKKPYAHGVSYNEYSKLGAILYLYTGKKEYLDASIASYKKIDRYFMLIDGLHCSNEYLNSNGVMQSHETCCISDYTWSLNYLYEATKDTTYLDKIEKCIFNAGLGAVTDDFKALQYFSCVNQVVLDNKSNHNVFFKGSEWMSYRPRPGTECCPGNVNRFMPNYILNSWAAESNDVYLKLFGESKFVFDGVEIIEETNYPFDNTVKISIKCSKVFNLHIRLPQWVKSYSLNFNGEVSSVKKGFITLCVENDCEFLIKFDCELVTHRKDNYVWFSKGVLVYSYDPNNLITIDKDIPAQTEEFPAFNIYAKNDWAYGVDDDCNVIENDNGTLSLEVYEIDNWKLKRVKRLSGAKNESNKNFPSKKENFVFTPPIPIKPQKSGKKQLITLVPYGKTLCRITAFPRIKRVQK